MPQKVTCSSHRRRWAAELLLNDSADRGNTEKAGGRAQRAQQGRACREAFLCHLVAATRADGSVGLCLNAEPLLPRSDRPGRTSPCPAEQRRRERDPGDALVPGQAEAAGPGPRREAEPGRAPKSPRGGTERQSPHKGGGGAVPVPAAGSWHTGCLCSGRGERRRRRAGTGRVAGRPPGPDAFV